MQDSGTNLKSLVRREDAARVCLLAAQGSASRTRVFNVAAPPGPMAEVVAGLAAALGRCVPLVRVPGPVALGAARALGFEAGVGLREGLRREVAWYRRQRA